MLNRVLTGVSGEHGARSMGFLFQASFKTYDLAREFGQLRQKFFFLLNRKVLLPLEKNHHAGAFEDRPTRIVEKVSELFV